MKCEDDERVDMAEEELQQWVRAQVEKDERLVQRQAQLVQVEDWVKQKESEATYTQLLYNNACESVLECESVVKGLYGMLGLEYRDTDSEEEGGKTPENVLQITDTDLNNEDDEHADNDDWDDDYVVIDLGAAVPETAVMKEQKEVDVSAAIESSVQPIAQNVKRPDSVDLPTDENPTSELSNLRETMSDDPLPTVKTSENTAPTAAPSPIELSAQCLIPKRESSPVSLGTPSPMNETVETPALIVANASTNDTDRLETRAKHNGETQRPLASSTLTSAASKSVSASKSPKTVSVNRKHSDAPTTSDTAGKATTREKVQKGSSKSSSKPSGTTTTTPPSRTAGKTAPAEKPKTGNPKQGDKPETKSPGSSSHSGTKDTPAADKTSTKPPDADQGTKEVSQTSQITPVTPARVQQEVILKVNMSILGRRRTKTWHQGTILDIKSTEGGPRYKILFEGGKGKSVVSAHHLASVDPPMLKDLFVGCRVVASYKEDNQSWLHAAVVAEMPDRKNRMRFLVFFDDGRSAYIALPDLHLVCKPLTHMTEDIEDEEWRAEVEEYLQTYPNPIFVVMRLGQESTVVRDGELELCTIIQVDSSLIQICYKNDNKTEWLYKGSNRLEQIKKIKKRMNLQKKEQAVNKAGWIISQKHTRLPSITTTSTTNTVTNTNQVISSSSTTTTTTTSSSSSSSTVAVTASKTVPTNITPVKPSIAQSVFQTASPVTSSSSMNSTLSTKSITQPLVVLNRVTLPSAEKTVKIPTHSESPGISASISGTKRPPPEEEDCGSQNALLPGVEPRLKYVPHRCCPACLNDVRPVQRDQHRGQNPLLIPMLHRFRRMTARRRLEGKMSFHVFYRAPCGRSLCMMEEVQAFLFESRCDFLFLDMFCLDPFVLVKRALLPSSMVSHNYVFLPDISEGKELVPVRCVNEINTVAPLPLTYTRHRVPAPGVIINTSLDFMVGCDCTDGCRDRSKCACYQMTIEATSLFSGGPMDVTAGYTHKRLPGYVPTGVYECNSLCHCDPKLCGNRLVQHGLQLRLEVFMTRNKGWGLRCLDDVSKGTFVCVFTGDIVKDETVNAESTMTGNEYLANLDYIEGVEKLKEGYESDVYCSDKEEESDKKTLVTMTTGALKKHDMFLIDSSSSSSEEMTKANIAIVKIEQEVSFDGSDENDEEDDDDVDDMDFKISSSDWTDAELRHVKVECSRSYTTRRSKKIPDEKEFHLAEQTSVKVSDEQTEVTASIAKKMKKEGGPRTGFAKKSTRSFAIKSSHRRVKPEAEPEECVPKKPPAHKCTRSLFDDEKACYLIDAKQEGNLSRYINHSCNPNLFVQNVFVDTHDLRFPWVAFFASKRIRAGTELTWDYSYEVGSVEGKVLLCCCGSSKCTGRLL